MHRSAFRIVVLASGTGTNLQAILDSCTGATGSRSSGSAPTSPGRGRWSGPRGRGRDRGLPAEEYADREARDVAMADWIEGLGADLVVLAGYMQLLSADSSPASATASSTSTPPCCPPSPGSTRSARRSTAGVEAPG